MTETTGSLFLDMSAERRAGISSGLYSCYYIISMGHVQWRRPCCEDFSIFFFFAQRDCSGIPIGDLQASGPWIIVAFQPFIDAM